MLITTQDEFADYRIVETLGLVEGNTVRARNLGRDISASFKGLVGGEISGYSRLMLDARNEALDRMIEMAEGIDADGVVALRFETANVMSNAAEIYVYGTAVKLESL